MQDATEFISKIMIQPELSFATPPAAQSELVAFLKGRGWMTAKELRQHGFTDRQLREIVENNADGEILSFPGSPGYRLFDEAIQEELARYQSLRSQARIMLQRFVRYERRRHRRLSQISPPPDAASPPFGNGKPSDAGARAPHGEIRSKRARASGGVEK